ncbi:MAG: rod shape-determining protein [Clostridia bacterium]|nr:rod shape-determining protein [Clostridia bacterium]MBN2883945.1 rod shape-determining protein [Clostridia bacterium]
MSLFGRDIGIDLGTANTIIFERGKGIILREPSVVAADEKKKEVIAVGEEAKKMVGRTPGTISAIRPLKDGVIADYNCTLQMLNRFIRKAVGKRMFVKPRLIICVPAGVTKVEKKAVIEAGLEAGAKEVFVAEESIMAALGAGLPVLEPTGNMIVDIGGGTSEVAVISMGRIVTSTTLRIAGDRFDEVISQYIRKKYRLFIGNRTAENIKIKLGNLFPSDYSDEMEIRGRNMTQGLPVNLTITSDEVAEAMEDIGNELLEAVRSTLERTPPELAADVMVNGIYLTGGGALIRGIDKFISTRTGNIPVYIAENPLDCVAIGTGKALENLDYLSGATKK